MATLGVNPLGLVFVALGLPVLVASVADRPEIGPMNVAWTEQVLGRMGKRVVAGLAGAFFVAVGVGVILGYF